MSVSFISGRTKDSVHLVYKDHRFSRDRTRNDTIYWRCMMSRKTPLNPIICKARISTDKDGNIISVGQSHNHPPNKLEIQIRTCISDIKRLGVLHEKDQMDVSEQDLFKKLVENFPDKLKPERRKIGSRQQRPGVSVPMVTTSLPRQQRPKLQRQDMRRHHAPVLLNCGSQLEIGIPSRTMPTFSLAHLSDNNPQFQLTVDMKPMVVEPGVSLPMVTTSLPMVTTSLPMVTNQPAPSLHPALQVSPHNGLQPAAHTPPLNSPHNSMQPAALTPPLNSPHTSPLSSPQLSLEPSTAMFASLNSPHTSPLSSPQLSLEPSAAMFASLNSPHTSPLSSPQLSLEPSAAMLASLNSPHTSPLSSPQLSLEPSAAMLASLEKELLSLLDVEELSKLMPLFSGDVDKNTPLQPWAPEIERLFSEVLLRNPIA